MRLDRYVREVLCEAPTEVFQLVPKVAPDRLPLSYLVSRVQPLVDHTLGVLSEVMDDLAQLPLLHAWSIPDRSCDLVVAGRCTPV
jgi:hypothetical protein